MRARPVLAGSAVQSTTDTHARTRSELWGLAGLGAGIGMRLSLTRIEVRKAHANFMWSQIVECEMATNCLKLLRNASRKPLGQAGGGLSAKVLCEVDKLPQVELYPSRFLEIIQTECVYQNLKTLSAIYAKNIQKCCWHVMEKTATWSYKLSGTTISGQ